MRHSYCIICGNMKNGIAVREDYVIGAIRAFKRNVTKNEQGNRLVVCRGCYPEYKKKRDRFGSRQAIYIALGVLFAVFTMVISFSVGALVIAVAVIAVLYLFSLFSYIPALDARMEPARAKPG